MLVKIIGAVLGAFLAVSPALSERVPVQLGQPLARANLLKPGVRTYVRYFLSTNGAMEVIDIQTKEIRFESEGTAPRMRVIQRWDGPKQSRRLDSLVERDTLRPLTHQRDITQDGKLKREGFRFLPGEVVGLEGLSDNSRAGFAIATPQPPFNFEIDFETLQALPLRRDAEFAINFYHAGGGPPKTYIFKVAGEETITFAGKPLGCWVVTTDYGRPNDPPSRFWIAKESQTVVRTHGLLPDGRAVIKALLPTTAP